MRRATWMRDAIIAKNELAVRARKANLEKWADVFRMMREIDKLAEAEIKAVMEFIFLDDPDPFWRTQIQSAAKFREKWDVLAARMLNPKRQQQAEFKL
jgi:hypothetical protein